MKSNNAKAFKTSGADKNNATIRYRALYNKFFNKTNFDLQQVL